MNTKTKHGCRRLLAMLLVVISVMGLIAIPAFAGQEDGYHDPAERWMNASNRTNELDVNATVTHETFHCYICKQPTSFQVWRTPEYTKDGQTAMIRNIRYGDGTFRAAQEITRAEVVTIVNRLLDRTADKAYLSSHARDLNTFSDMEKTHWAYYAVMEAANAHIATFDEEEAWSK